MLSFLQHHCTHKLGEIAPPARLDLAVVTQLVLVEVDQSGQVVVSPSALVEVDQLVREAGNRLGPMAVNQSDLTAGSL